MIATALKSRMLRVLGSAVADQAMLSAANFLVGILLIRYTGDSDYGMYVLAFTTVALVVMAQGAWVSNPLTILASKREEVERQTMIGSIWKSQSRMLSRLLPLVLVLIGLLWIFSLISADQAAVLAAGTLAAWTALRREFLRSVLLIYGRPQTMLAVDALYVVALISSVLLAAFGPLKGAPMAVLGLAIAAGVGSWAAEWSLTRNPGWKTDDAGPFWAQMRPLGVWALTGALIFWVASQGYNYILALKLDAAAVGAVNAARLLLMPTYLITTGIKGVLLPMAARWLVEGGYGVLIRRLSLFIVGLAVPFAAYFVLLWAANDWVLAVVMKKQLPEHDFLLLMWAVLSANNLVRETYQAALLLRERQRELAWLAALSAVFSTVTIWPAIDHFGLRGAMWGLLAGEVFYSLGILYLCWRESHRQEAVA